MEPVRYNNNGTEGIHMAEPRNSAEDYPPLLLPFGSRGATTYNHPGLRLPVHTKPFAHQVEAFGTALEHPACALLMEQGTGKTLSAIATVGERFEAGQVGVVLILCPLSLVYEWKRQIKKHANFDYHIYIPEGSSDKKLKFLEKYYFDDPSCVHFYILNYESAWRIGDWFLDLPPDMVIADESQKFKNPSTKIGRFMNHLGRKVKYKMILTGTPVTQSPLDFFSQYRFLDHELFGGSFNKFKQKYAIMGGYGGYQIMGYRDLEGLAAIAHSIAYRITKAEALDLPDTLDENRYVDMPASAWKIYTQMAKDAIAELENETTTAPIVLTKLLRLSQIAGGFLTVTEPEKAVRSAHGAKLAALREIVEDTLAVTGKKVVVFAHFIPEIEAIMEELAEFEPRCIMGSTPPTLRAENVEEFQVRPDVRVIVIQIATGGLGITLTAADTAVFYSMTYSLADYEQAKARLHRIGQENKVTYIHLLARGTIDEEVLTRLQAKRDVATFVVDDLRRMLREAAER